MTEAIILAKTEVKKAIGEGEQKHSVLQGKYELGRVLGQGTFARVYHARNVQTGKSVAMKVVGKQKVIKAKMMEQVKREISVMKRLKHPNIVELYEVMASKLKVYLAMELVRGGELFTKVSKGGKLTEDVARECFRQLISAVDFCHSRGVYHRDLKLENLLVDHNGNVKVSDFGLSAFFEDVGEEQEQLLRTSCGTPHYVAPEVVSKRGQGYDGARADIWSCGVILYVLLAGYLPFNDDNLINMYRKIYKGNFTCPSWFTPDARDLITRMLDPKPNSRITIPEIVVCEWFNMSHESTPLINNPQMFHENNTNDDNNVLKSKEPEALNAFHIISLSHGLDLSPLFAKRRDESEEMRFTTTKPASTVISRLEEVAAKSGKFEIDKAGESLVRLQGPRRGRRTRLAIAAELYSISKSFLVVEVKKDDGDAIEFNQFCHNQLRPAFQDIVWTAENPTPAC